MDEVIALDAEYRAAITEGDGLRAQRNKLSKSIGALMAQGKKDEAEAVKKQVTEQADRLKELEMREAELQEEVRQLNFANGVEMVLLHHSTSPYA